jgi:hypothetical protein
MTISSLLTGLRGEAALPGEKHRVAPSIDWSSTHAKTKAGRSSKQVTEGGLVVELVVRLAFGICPC